MIIEINFKYAEPRRGEMIIEINFKYAEPRRGEMIIKFILLLMFSGSR